MGRILKFYIVFVIVFSLGFFVFAVPDDSSSGGTGEGGNYGSGGWSPSAVGMKVSIVTSGNVVRDSEFFLNTNGKKSGKFTSDKKPKMHQGTSFSWVSADNTTSYTATFLPSNWVDSNNNTINLHSILSGSEYANLKAVIEHSSLQGNVGYGDYIVVEPMTLIHGYYGTAYELAHKGLRENHRGAVFGGSSSRPTGGIFRTSIYLIENVDALGLKIFTGTSYTEKNDNFLDKTGGLGIGVFKYNDVYKTGKIEVKKYKEGTSTLLTSSSATFKIYDEANCSGNVVDTLKTNNSGIASTKDLAAGTYSIYEETTPSGYVAPSNKCVEKNVTVTAGQTTPINIYNTPSCSTKLSDLGSNPTVAQLLNLYKEYPNNTNLLNFSNPSCSKKTCDDSSTLGNLKITGCLAAKGESSSFNATNLSCFDDEYKNHLGNSIAFCKNIFELKNNIGVDKFYSKSGQFLIKKVTLNVFQIYNQDLDPVSINTNYVTTASIDRICYALPSNDMNVQVSTLPNLSVYFNDEDRALSADVDEERAAVTSEGSFNKYSFKKTYNYKLNYVYLEKLTGKVFDEKKPNTGDAIEGIVSKFDETEGTIYFNVKYNNKDAINDNKNRCTYKTTPEIVIDDDLDLEFRSIDTKNPFNRRTNSNWCDGNDCSKDNDVVKNYIVESVNSYGKDHAGTTHKPLYKIILNSNDIKIIKSYNEDNKYDYYRIIEKNSNKVNAFVYDLKIGILRQYDSDGDITKTYGELNKMTGIKTE